MLLDDEIEEFRRWRKIKLNMSPLDEAFENLERIMANPFTRGFDSAFRVMGQCLMEIKRHLEVKG